MARRWRARYRVWAVCVCLLAAAGCNSPYPDSDEEANTVYTTFRGEIGHMDPARAYGGTRYTLICNILEPPLQYHFLKRPYELNPLAAAEVPKARKRTIPRADDPDKTQEVIVYTVRIKKGIFYQNHQCFVPSNRRLTDKDMRGGRRLADVKAMGTRELVAKDYVFAIRRLADPRQISAILTTLEQTVLGMAEYADAFEKELDRQRELRRKEGGPGYSQLKGERVNPIPIDHWQWPLPGVKLTGKYEFEIILKRPYPQILYWMAMPFFAPVPPEAIEFYSQRLVLERGIMFYNDAIGTGPYKLEELDPTNQLVLVRNENYREEYYPHLPEPPADDAEAVANYKVMKDEGMLDDDGMRLPMVDRFVFRREREWIPQWNKFLQGYYDWSDISSDTFDTAISLTSEGDPTLSDEMAERGIRLQTAPAATISFYAFNMQDPVVGGYTEKHRKLRQAITIAFDVDEYLTIFDNNRSAVAHSPTPPGIFGYESGKVGMNPVPYRWDDQLGRPVRRAIDEAKKLLAEAGYPGGVGADGRRLAIRFDNAWATASHRPMLKFVAKQFDKLGIQLDIETTTDNFYWQKIREGHYQFIALGWRADYPDIENFHFMLYGENARYRGGTENNANYYNPEFDKLFEQARHMENTDERLKVIRRMNRIIQQDAPWIFGMHRRAFSLVHGWCKNSYPSDIVLNNLKYRRVDFKTRTQRRREWNEPRWVPIWILSGVLGALLLLAVALAVYRMREA